MMGILTTNGVNSVSNANNIVIWLICEIEPIPSNDQILDGVSTLSNNSSLGFPVTIVIFGAKGECFGLFSYNATLKTAPVL